jgi:hypothetical protein
MLTCVFSCWCSADVTTIGAVKDTTLYEHETGDLSNGAGSYLFVGKTANGDIRRGLILFDIAGNLPAGVNITNVVLTLNMSKSISGAQSVSLHSASTNWGEGASNAGANEGKGIAAENGDATWLHTFYSNNFWTVPGGDFDAAPVATVSVSGNGAYSWTTPGMGMDVQSWLDTPAANFGWLIQGNEAANTTAKRFDTRENGTEANRPALEIAYIIPEPHFCLIFPAAVLLALRRKRT